MAQTLIDCDQCNGTGWLNGVRCGCGEADDDAQARRQQMGILKKMEDSKLKMAGLCPVTQPQQRRCPHELRQDIQTPPKFMRDLPIDKRGYPVPAFVDWIKGEPEFRAMNPRFLVKAINQRLCWTCGKPLYGEEVFVIGPMCAVNRVSSEPPSHRECALYAATNCPFLSKPQMVRRKDGLPGDFGKNAAGVMIERNPGVTLLYYTRRHRLIASPEMPEAGAHAGVLFSLGRPFKTEWYARGRLATRAEVLESMDSGFELLHATAAQHDGPEGVELLDKQYAEAMRMVPR